MKPRQQLLALVMLHSAVSLTRSDSKISISADGGYSNIVIKLDTKVNPLHCAHYIERISTLITEASAVLHTALGGRAYFKQATLVVPAHWDDSKCGLRVSEPGPDTAWHTADMVVVAGAGPPHTQHSLGCGRQGEQISFSESFFTNWNASVEEWGEPAKLFVKEWAKFRYGVFDEHGYPGSLLYPAWYKVQGALLPAGTADRPVAGRWRSPAGAQCDPQQRQQDCKFQPEGDNSGLSCSLGFLPQLPSVTSWCNSTGLPLAPTKHTVLCEARPAAQVIADSADWVAAGPGQQRGLQLSLVPRIDIVRQPLTRYVLLIETSTAMAAGWKWTRKAVQSWVRYQLPAHSTVAIITFSSGAEVESELVRLAGDSARARVADTVPDSANKLSSSGQACLECAVRLAGRVLAGRAGGHLVAVTSGPAPAPPPTRERLTVVSVAGAGPDRSPLQRYVELVERLSGVVAEHSRQPHTLHTAITANTDHSSSGQFRVDTDLGRDTEFGIYVEDDEDHRIKSITFQDSQSNIYGPFTTMSSYYDSINLKTINFNVGESPPFEQRRGSEWSYNIDWYSSEDDRKSIVTVRSLPRYDEPITVSAWTSAAAPPTSLTQDTLLAVFVQVRYGGAAVENATVEVSVVVSLDNGTEVEAGRVTMLDNGYGEPDTVAGDGVYSGFLTRYPGPGRYSLDIGVEDGGRAATRQAGLLGVFTRRGPAITVPVVAVAGTRLIRPAKVGDLALAAVPGTADQLLATWTAPGGDYNDGPVVSYRFVFSHKMEELLAPAVTIPALDGLKREDMPGQAVSHTVKFQYYNQDYYVGMFAFDQLGNRGRMSNIVLVNIPAPVTEDSLTESRESPATAETPWTLVAALLGGLGLLVIIVLATLLTCKFCHKSTVNKFSKDSFAKTLKSSGVKVEFPSPAQSESTETSSYESELAGKQRSSTSFGSGLTPTYWSASQLLGQHEERVAHHHHHHHQHPPQHQEYDPGLAGGLAGYDVEYAPATNYGYYEYDMYGGRRLSTTSEQFYAEQYGVVAGGGGQRSRSQVSVDRDMRNITQV